MDLASNNIFEVCILNFTGLDILPTLYDLLTYETSQLEICQIRNKNAKLYYNKIQKNILSFDKIIICSTIGISAINTQNQVLVIDLRKLDNYLALSNAIILLQLRKNGKVKYKIVPDNSHFEI